MSSSWYSIYLSSSWCDVYLYEDNSDAQNKSNHRQYIKSLVINMLQNLNHRYSSHNNNIKYVASIIKCIDFELIYYVINLNVVSYSIVFSDFDSIFISMYC